MDAHAHSCPCGDHACGEEDARAVVSHQHHYNQSAELEELEVEHDHSNCGGHHGHSHGPPQFVLVPNKFLDKSKFDVASEAERDGIRYVQYEDERQMPLIMNLITKDLSEPYSIYTYRYFIHNWPELCFLAMDGEKCVGAIVCKLDRHKDAMRGYIAMLDVDEKLRKRGIGSHLASLAIKRMIQRNADEIVLEAEVTNKGALRLYENLGFVRDKRLFRYYLNGVEAFRLKLWLK